MRQKVDLMIIKDEIQNDVSDADFFAKCASMFDGEPDSNAILSQNRDVSIRDLSSYSIFSTSSSSTSKKNNNKRAFTNSSDGSVEEKNDKKEKRRVHNIELARQARARKKAELAEMTSENHVLRQMKEALQRANDALRQMNKALQLENDTLRQENISLKKTSEENAIELNNADQLTDFDFDNDLFSISSKI